MYKRHEFVARLSGAQREIRAHISKRLKGIRAIYLREYHIDGLAPAAPYTWQLQFNSELRPQQTSSDATAGFLISSLPNASATSHRTVYDKPILVSQHNLSVLTDMTISVTDVVNAPVVFTEMTLWLQIEYYDDYTDLDVVASEGYVGMPVQGQNQWRTGYYAPDKMTQDQITETLTRHIFSDL